MKSALLGALALSTLVPAGGAIAADMPVKAPAPAAYVASNWSGFYVGANGGYAWDRSSIDLAAISAFFNGTLATGEIPRATSFTSHSAIGGLQAGYNRQSGNFVFGV